MNMSEPALRAQALHTPAPHAKPAAVPQADRLRVGLGTTMIEPALTRGHLDGIGVYTQALRRHLPQAGCELTTYSWPRVRGQVALSAGQALPQSFERASLVDLVTPGAHRV